MLLGSNMTTRPLKRSPLSSLVPAQNRLEERCYYDRWLRFILPFMVKIWIVGSIALAVAVWIGYA